MDHIEWTSAQAFAPGWPERGASPAPGSPNIRGAQPWPIPPESVVRIRSDASPYFVDVEMVRDEDGSPMVTGIAIRTPWPTVKQRRKTRKVKWRLSFSGDPEFVSGREVQRLPLGMYVRAALAIASSGFAFPLDPINPERRGQLHQRLRRALGTGDRPEGTNFYKGLLAEFRLLESHGVRSPAKEIARRRNVPVNRVYQWLYRARRLEQKGEKH